MFGLSVEQLESLRDGATLRTSAETTVSTVLNALIGIVNRWICGPAGGSVLPVDAV